MSRSATTREDKKWRFGLELRWLGKGKKKEEPNQLSYLFKCFSYLFMMMPHVALHPLDCINYPRHGCLEIDPMHGSIFSVVHHDPCFGFQRL